jgi:hypothetical protein
MPFTPFMPRPARRPPQPPTVLRTRAQCESLARDTQSLRLATPVALTLDLPIDRAVQAEYQADINRLVQTCGCAESALVMLVCLALSMIGLWRLGLGQSLGLPTWVLSIVAFLGSALFGLLVKLLILNRAGRRLRKAFQQLAVLCIPA